jgi:phosphonate transport system substrate-binding protein
MRKRPIACILFVLCLPLLAACSPQEPPAPAKKPPVRKLEVGLLPEQNIFRQVERYEPLMAYLGRKTGVKFDLKILPRYGNIVRNFKSLGLDGAFFGSFTYALAHSRMGLVVLARPENENGISTYHGLIFVRKDSGIRTARGMKGKRLACVDKATTAGYLLPLGYFHENGIDDCRKHLKEIYFAGTHEDAILDVLNRKADIGAAKNTVYERMAVKDNNVKNALAILAVSPEVPENALALRGDIEEELKKKIKGALLAMNQDPEGKEILKRFGAARFIETTDKDYEPVFRYAREGHIDLATYDYLND